MLNFLKTLKLGSCQIEIGNSLVDAYDISVGPTEHLTLQKRRPSWQRQRYRIVGTPHREHVRIVVAEDALAQVHRHAASSFNEIGGVLIGRAYAWGGRTYVEINVTIPGNMTRAGRAHVTFTADTWAELLRRQEREFPDQMIVGWYHSHPRMGIFLSGLDLSIQRGFFQSPWHIALVVNGQDCKGGFFVWDRDQIKPARGFYLMDARLGWPQLTVRQDHDSFSYDISPTRPELPSLSWRALVIFSLAIVGIYVLRRWFSKRPKRRKR